MTKPLVYLILGPEGSGKSTLARLLSEDLGIPFISSGSLIRREMGAHSDLGKQMATSTDAYVSDDVVIPYMLHVLEDPQYKQGFILEGFPRDVVQLRALEQFLADRDMSITHVIHVTLPEEIALQRLIRRGRADDTEEGIRARLAAFTSRRDALLKEAREKGHLVEIDNTDPIEQVFARLQEKLHD